MKKNIPLVLCILDGWGYRKETKNNAISLANTPFWDELVASSPYSFLETKGEYVGLPGEQIGSSEVGHMNIGAGRVVCQNLVKINNIIKKEGFKNNSKIKKFISDLKSKGGRCHIAGLLSEGGVHSHQNHISYIIKLLSEEGVDIVFHAFLDGRDSPEKSALSFIQKFYKDIEGIKNISFGSISGRYYGMDRDNRWDRTEKSYKAIVDGTGIRVSSFEEAVSLSYDKGISDEFMIPAVVEGYKPMSDNDALFIANYRSDRIIQIIKAICDPDFDKFKRERFVNLSAGLGMVSYSEDTNNFLESLVETEMFNNILGEVISNNSINQFRIAETEKYAHVTFFFNCSREEVFKGEDRVLIPSPDVPTYDEKPEMSSFELTERLVKEIKSEKYGFILVNYANTDMVGHTGNMDAAVKAVESVDKCLKKVVEAANLCNSVVIITADHGNIEKMKDENNEVYKAHTDSLVYFLLTGSADKNIKLKDGSLCNIAPTILELMSIEKPEEMSDSLILKK